MHEERTTHKEKRSHEEIEGVKDQDHASTLEAEFPSVACHTLAACLPVILLLLPLLPDCERWLHHVTR